jgi:pimeloyl-ACP methyl ester carboxylesterase
VPYAAVGDTNLYYEVSGPEWGEPLVMIHGLGCQIIHWNEGLTAMLEASGYRTIRFDNRDAGLTSWTSVEPDRYSIADMADDVLGLLDHLGIASAHVMGISMGGLMAQEFAIAHPDRLSSALLLCTMPSLEFWTQDEEVLASRTKVGRGDDRQTRIDDYIAQEQFAGVSGLGHDWLRRLAERQYDRAYRPGGTERQQQALEGYGNRLDAISRITAPVAIFHGRGDRLIGYRGAIASALALPQAELLLAPGVGHELPPFIWADLVRMIDRNVARSRDLSLRVDG